MSKQSNIPQLRFKGFEGEWERGKLNKFAVINPKNSELPESFIYIDLESVTDGLLIKESIISKNEAPSRAQRILKDKDILYQTVRPYQKNNLYFDKTGNYVASTGYAQIRTKNDSKFLFQFLHTEGFVTNVMLRCTGTSYPAINSSDLSNIEISFPTLPEQEKIASFLSAVDEKIQQLTSKAALLEQYKKGVMQQLFSGKLRFKDENGEEYADWEEKKLGEVADFYKGKGLPKNDIVENGKYKCLHYGELFTKYKESISNIISSTNTYDKPFLSIINDVSMPTSDVTPNGLATASCINENDVILGGDVLVIRQKVKFFDGIFFSYYVTQNREKVMKLVSGSTVYHLYGSDMKKMEIQIPCLAEQQKIAGFLSGIDEKIGVVRGELEKMQGFKKGLLQQMFV